MSRRWAPVATFGVAVAAFLALHASALAGDALHWVGAITANTLPLPGGAQHFLFPWLGWAGDHLLRLAHVPLARFGADGLLRGLVALWAGLALAIWTAALTGLRTRWAWAGALLVAGAHLALFFGWGADAMVAAPFLALAGLALLHAPATWRAPLTGLAIALATACWQPALWAVVPGAALLAFRQPRRTALLRAALILLCAFAGYLAIGTLGTLLAHTGTHGLLGWLLDDAATRAALDPHRVTRALAGTAGGFSPWRSWLGSSTLARLTWGERLRWLLVVVAAVAMFGGFVRLRSAAALVAAWAWLTGIYLLACYWAAPSEKLWLGAVFAFTVLVVHAWDRPSWRKRLGAFSGGLLALALGGALAVQVQPDAELSAADALARRVDPNDLVVCAGWDPLCDDYTHVVSRDRPHFSVSDEAVQVDRDPLKLRAALDAAISRTEASGHHVYFLELLDLSRSQWTRLFGLHVRLPFESLDDYRARSRPVGSLAGVQGSRLRRLDP